MLLATKIDFHVLETTNEVFPFPVASGGESNISRAMQLVTIIPSRTSLMYGNYVASICTLSGEATIGPYERLESVYLE